MSHIRRKWWNRLFSWFRPQGNPLSPGRRRPVVEELEPRNLPQGGTWTPLANLAPDAKGIQAMILLSDGTVMAQGGSDTASKNWYRLTPDATGSYVNGTWSSLASMSLERLFFASNVLPDGRVFVLGGEYSGPTTKQNWINSGEIYDPVTNVWSSILNFPQTQFGDDPTEVLPNGEVLAGYLSGPQTYLFNPVTDTWTQTGNKLRTDQSDEESWVKLPDRSILSYDIFASTAVPGSAQRYIPSTGTWVDAGTVPILLSNAAVGEELGPAFLLPDGRVFYIGGIGGTSALYTPSTNSWAIGPAIPGTLAGDDAPGAVLPNGNVIFFADTPLFKAPTEVFDFNYTTNTISTLTTPAALTTALNTAAFLDRTLVLPSGQMLLTTSKDQLWVFTPDGSPQNGWRPTIRSVSLIAPNTYLMTGTQLNGISEGAAYGDDAEMASNYPIVRLTEPNGNVVYARTFNWSSTGVATGSTIVSTEFTLPSGLTPGFNPLTVIANGIPSLEQYFNGVKIYHPVRYTYSPATGLISGNLILANQAGADSGVTLRCFFPDLPSGVTLANATGTSGGIPYLDVRASMAAGQAQYVFIQFRDPNRIPISTFFFKFHVLMIIGIST